MFRLGTLSLYRTVSATAGHIMTENETDAIARDRDYLDTTMVEIAAPEPGADDATILYYRDNDRCGPSVQHDGPGCQ